MIKMHAIGHIGKDATVNNINGQNVINFNVAHTEKYKDKEGQQVEKTTWLNCSYWVERTTVAPYLKKGTQVFVEGMPSVDTYRNEQGVTIPQLRLKVSAVQLLGSKQESATPSQPVQAATGAPAGDLPF